MEQPLKYNYARDGFIYLLSYATLIVASVSVNFLAKALVNRWIPDVADQGFLSDDRTIIGFLAAVVIALPIFVYLNYLANKMLKSARMKADSGVRLWLIYITLVVMILIIIWQLTALLMVFLSGTLVTQFLVHTLITLVVSGLILGYQWWHLRFFTATPRKIGGGFRIFEWVVLLSVAGIVGWTFATIASPAALRAQRLDQIRVERLSGIRSAIQEFYGWGKSTGHRRLPRNFDELEKDPRVYLGGDGLVDPVTKEPFGYHIINATTYELSATFDTEFKEDTAKSRPASLPPPDSREKIFYHGAGKQSFRLSVV